MGYERFGGDLTANDGWDLRDHVWRLARQRGFDKRHEELATWPAAARHVYFLHLAESMLAGSGVLAFLSQQLYPDLRGTHDALAAAGAGRLQRLFEAGIAATLDTSAEYNHYRRGRLKSDFRWLRAVQKSEPVAAAIDTHDEGGTYWLVKNELAPAIRRYIFEQRSELAE